MTESHRLAYSTGSESLGDAVESLANIRVAIPLEPTPGNELGVNEIWELAYLYQFVEREEDISKEADELYSLLIPLVPHREIVKREIGSALLRGSLPLVEKQFVE